MKLPIASLALAITLASQTQAQPIMADGQASGQSRTEVIELGADHRILNTRVEYVKMEMASETNPMNQLSGPCFGVVEVRGGAAEGGGVCAFNGLEGDTVLLGWVARRVDPRGRMAGYWTVNYGTGLYLKASGGGAFLSETNPANGTATNTFTGAIALR
ncbi:MAG: hypothetical protein AAF678_11705 [Pseudomonadota bacterium]